VHTRQKQLKMPGRFGESRQAFLVSYRFQVRPTSSICWQLAPYGLSWN
jgi:hypothetical protein